MKVQGSKNVGLLVVIGSLLFVGCGGGGGNSFFGGDGSPFGGNSVAQENSKELMGLAVGMHKQEVFKLAGVAGFIEGYDWGSVWFYQTKDGGEFGTLNDRHVQERYTPVVFGNTDHVIGYGPKFYDQTIKDLGTGNY